MAINKNIKINLDYSEFTGGIKECQSKMQLLTSEFKLQQAALGNNASEIDKLTLSQSTLNQKIQLQSQIVEQAAERLATLAASEDATANQVDRAQQAFLKQSTVLQQMKNELDSTNDKLGKLSQEEENVSESSENSASGMNNFGSSITEVINTAGTVISVLQQVGSLLYDVASSAGKAADDLLTLSTQTSVSADTLQKWGYASIYVDTSVETMTSSMTKLVRNMDEAASGSDAAVAKFERLGVSVTNADGSLRNAEAVFYDTIDALGQISNSAERDAASMDIFGKSAQQLNPLIEAGSSALSKYGKELEALGYTLGKGELQNLSSMSDAFESLSMKMDLVGQQMVAAIAPAITEIVNILGVMPPQVLGVIAVFSGLFQIVQTVTPVVQAFVFAKMALTSATVANTVATTAETAAEVELGVAATATNAAFLPQIATVALLVAAFAGLLIIIEKIIEALTKEADAADKASEATQGLADASTGTSSSSSSSGAKHYARGGSVSGGSVWVGEQGAELVDLPGGSYVHNSTDSRNMSSTTNIYNVTIDAKSVKDFNSVVSTFSGLSQSMNRGGFVNG